MKNRTTCLVFNLPAVSGALLILLVTSFSSCGIYSFSGVNITAKDISIAEFYNNTDLGPANLGQTFTNKLKDYMLRNTNLAITQENGELQLEGVVTEFRVLQVAPTISTNGSASPINASSQSQLSITVRVSYVNTKEEAMSFKDKTFTFKQNIDNSNPDTISEAVINIVFDQIILDIFNATVANW